MDIIIFINLFGMDLIFQIFSTIKKFEYLLPGDIFVHTENVNYLEKIASLMYVTG
jgi:hypothetical protein|tara:strand:- start:315 stop:479 length:165 start_codon:yes stop_codon:yes gene_type:complete